jgi:hypothetical protein
MDSRELVDDIRSGPADLELCRALRFRRRTCFNGRFNPCDFDELLQALQSSKTIRDVFCLTQQALDISEDEWVFLVKTTGRIRDIQSLRLCCRAGSREFCPFQTVADALNNARSLRNLTIHLYGQNFPGDSSGRTALANALREHTALRDFTWFDCVSWLQAAPVDLAPDLVLRALPACPHLRKVHITTHCASAGAMKTLLQLPKDADLTLLLKNKEDWLAVADGIRQGQCNIKSLSLVMLQNSSSEGPEAVKAFASAIRLDGNLEHLMLEMEKDFTDEAGMALAEALTIMERLKLQRMNIDFMNEAVAVLAAALAVNTTLRRITLYLHSRRRPQDSLSAPAYDAFSAMLRVNTSLVLHLPPFAGGDEKLVDSRNQMRIEQGLNHVGRGRLVSSSQTTREEWVDALSELNSRNADESPEFNVSCLYSLLRLNPATCM